MRGPALPLLLGLLIWWPWNAGARDLSMLYDASVLEQLRPRYERSTLRILTEVILPVLTTEEKRRLGGTPRVEFPLYAEGESKGRPLAFYVPPGPPRVVLPVLSLHFLDELCTAYAWLQINDYTLETVSEYTAMLRYRDFPGSKPPPLQALHIPDNALKDPRVDRLALGHFVTARTFILLHELGHLYHQHHATTYDESRRNEEEADRFAAVVMRRTPLPPLGALVFFFADANWSGYPSSAEDTHPLSGARLRALARQVDDPELASGLAKIGAFLDDPEIRAGFAASGKAGDIASLAPRRRGEMPHMATTDAATGSPAFHGRYVGQFTQLGNEERIPIQLVLERQGTRVKGQYSFGVGIGQITGTVVGDTLHFDWEWAGSQGRGKLISRDGGNAFDGTWGYRDSGEDAGTWNGDRRY
jgi:hypothetical protein